MSGDRLPHPPVPRLRRRISRKRVAVGLVAITTLAAGATGVNALSGRGSTQYAQGTRGVAGAVEVGDFFAASVAVGDFDNDGNGDIIAGAPNEDLGKRSNAGVVHVLYGTDGGTSTSGDISLHPASPNVAGKSERDDLFGSKVAVGDFNDDGYADAVVAAPGEDVGSKRDAGGITVLYGSARGLRAANSKEFTGATRGLPGTAEAFAYFGEALAVGDFDGNGIDDVAVGAPGSGGADNDSAGAVTILFGKRSGLSVDGSQRLHLDSQGVPGDRTVGDAFGASLAAGDFDGDGRDDLAVGIPGRMVGDRSAAGAVMVFAGSAGGVSRASATTFTQGTDGVPDSAEVDDRFGAMLASGNFDGDRFDDLAIGSPGESAGIKTAAGVVHVLYGSRGGISAAEARTLSQATKGIKSKRQAGDEFGASLVVGDFNDNGRDDLAIGAPGERLGAHPGAGVVHVVFGTRQGLRPSTHEWYRPGKGGVPGNRSANAGFGRALAVGDIDGDGRDDLVSGAPGTMIRGDAGAGALTVIFG